MKTDDLIRAIAADTGRPSTPMHLVWIPALGAAFLVAGIVFTGFLGPRPDFATAIESMRFLSKFLVTATLFVSTLPLLFTLARPGAGISAKTLLAAPALLLAAIALELVALPRAAWIPALVGTNAIYCLTLIPLLGVGPLAAMMVALRYGAPTRPALAGAVAGLVAGAIAATFYAAYCTDDSPLFVAVWYSFAVAVLALTGALAGRLALRW